MPLYEYECNDCQNRFERIQKFSDPLVSTCPDCGGAVHKLLSSPAIQFKGTGWYVTDYAKKPGGAPGGDGREGGEQKAEGGAKDDGGKAAAADKKQGSDSSASKKDATAQKKPASASVPAR